MASSKAPPPLPSREQRQTLSEEEQGLPAIQQLQVQEVPSDSAPEEVQEDFTPIVVQNGEPLVDQQVAPNRYLWYSAVIEGSVEDLVQFDVTRTLHGGATNIYVNVPQQPGDSSTALPTKESHSWNPKMGVLYGPPGLYVIGVEGVPSFIEKDDKWLVDPNANWATFDLYVQWTVLDVETRTTIAKMKAQYKAEKVSNVWSSNYTAEVSGKYQEQQQQYEQELAERQRTTDLQNAVQTLFNIDNTPIAANYVFIPAPTGATSGEGSDLIYHSDFCVVRAAKPKAPPADKPNLKVAVKIINKEKAQITGLDALVFQQQLDILKKISHPNIVPLIAHYDTDKFFAIVTELQEGGELISGILNRGSSSYGEADARHVVVQLLQALAYLHQQSIVHKSILAENVLFHAAGSSVIKLVGFGLSHSVANNSNANNTGSNSVSGGGDPAFQAPELIQQQPYSTKIDMWAVGVLTYILLCGYSPFQDSNTIRLYAKIRQGNFQFNAEHWAKVSPQAQSFVKSLICVDANARLDAAAALNHEWTKATGGSALPHVVDQLKNFYQSN